jgi:hypothetical protein
MALRAVPDCLPSCGTSKRAIHVHPAPDKMGAARRAIPTLVTKPLRDGQPLVDHGITSIAVYFSAADVSIHNSGGRINLRDLHPGSVRKYSAGSQCPLLADWRPSRTWYSTGVNPRATAFSKRPATIGWASKYRSNPVILSQRGRRIDSRNRGLFKIFRNVFVKCF